MSVSDGLLHVQIQNGMSSRHHRSSLFEWCDGMVGIPDLVAIEYGLQLVLLQDQHGFRLAAPPSSVRLGVGTY